MSMEERQRHLVTLIDKTDEQLEALKEDFMDTSKLSTRLKTVNSMMSLLELDVRKLQDDLNNGAS